MQVFVWINDILMYSEADTYEMWCATVQQTVNSVDLFKFQQTELLLLLLFLPFRWHGYRFHIICEHDMLFMHCDLVKGRHKLLISFRISRMNAKERFDTYWSNKTQEQIFSVYDPWMKSLSSSNSKIWCSDAYDRQLFNQNHLNMNKF